MPARSLQFNYFPKPWDIQRTECVKHGHGAQLFPAVDRILSCLYEPIRPIVVLPWTTSMYRGGMIDPFRCASRRPAYGSGPPQIIVVALPPAPPPKRSAGRPARGVSAPSAFSTVSFYGVCVWVHRAHMAYRALNGPFRRFPARQIASKKDGNRTMGGVSARSGFCHDHAAEEPSHASHDPQHARG
jgi:hypothetical protein